MSKTKILITGSAGFVGANTIRSLIKNFTSDYQIASIDKVNEEKLLHSIYLNKNHTFYMGDICDTHFLGNVFKIEKPDIVIHLAASNKRASSIVHTETNVTGTQNLIDQAVVHKVNKFIYISTSEIFSDHDSSIICPRTVYSTTKYTGELLVKNSGLKFHVLRPTNIFGHRNQRGNLITNTISSIIENKDINIYGDGSNIREYLYVNDFASALNLIIKNGVDEYYNVSSNWEFSSLEMVNQITSLMGRGNDLIKFLPDAKSDKSRTLDASRLRSLGWAPESKFKECLNSTVGWYQNNYNWFLK